MNNKRWFYIAILGVLSGNVLGHDERREAYSGEQFYLDAKVDHHRAAYGFVDVPASRCNRSRNRHKKHNNKGIGGAVIGGLLGGVVGNQVGGGSGKKIATIGGVVGGAFIGQRVATRGNDSDSDYGGGSCRKYQGQYQEERRVGYDVSYRLYGAQHVVRTQYEPQDTIRLLVTVTADEQ